MTSCGICTGGRSGAGSAATQGRWGRRREAGRSRYVLWYALRWGLSQWAVLSALIYCSGEHLSLRLAAMILTSSLGLRLIAGARDWANNERLYGRALRGGGAGR